jgi:hypothetical protein
MAFFEVFSARQKEVEEEFEIRKNVLPVAV